MNIHDATEQAYRNGYNKGYADALEGGWVSVKDGLPEDGEAVLIWVGNVQVARIYKGITEEERKNGEWRIAKSVRNRLEFIYGICFDGKK